MNWIIFAKVITTGIIVVGVVSFLCLIWFVIPRQIPMVEVVVKENDQIISTLTTDKLMFKDGHNEVHWEGINRSITVRKETTP